MATPTLLRRIDIASAGFHLPVTGSITSTVLKESPAFVNPPTAYKRPDWKLKKKKLINEKKAHKKKNK